MRWLPVSRQTFFIPLLLFSVEPLVGTFGIVTLHARGATAFQLLLLFAILFAVPLVHIPLSKTLHPRISLPFFALVRGASFLSLLLPVQWAVVVYPFLWGLQYAWFWVPYNTEFFRECRESSDRVSAMYFAVPQMITIVFSAAGGVLLATLGAKGFFVAGALLALGVAAAFTRLSWPVFSIDIAAAFRDAKKITPLLIAEGASNVGRIVIIPLYTLFFISGPASYGYFTAYLQLIAIVCVLAIAYFLHDRQFRMHAAALLAIGVGIVTAALAFASSVNSWILLSSVLTLIVVLLGPFSATLFIKNTDGSVGSWAAREWCLNLGRLLGTAAMMIAVLLASPEAALVAAGVLSLGYPVFILWHRFVA